MRWYKIRHWAGTYGKFWERRRCWDVRDGCAICQRRRSGSSIDHAVMRYQCQTHRKRDVTATLDRPRVVGGARRQVRELNFDADDELMLRTTLLHHSA